MSEELYAEILNKLVQEGLSVEYARLYISEYFKRVRENINEGIPETTVADNALKYFNINLKI